MTKKLFLLWVAFLLSSLLWAQKEKDYILTMQGDTLYGKIKLNDSSNRISFQYQGDRIVFHASTIEYFGIQKKEKLHNYKTAYNEKREEIFAEVLTEGKLNLYRYNTVERKPHRTEYSFRYLIGEKEIPRMIVSPSSYKNVLKYYIKNQPDLLAQKITYRDVPRIIEEYNRRCIKSSTDVLNYTARKTK